MIIVSQDKWTTIINPKVLEIDYSCEVSQYKIKIAGKTLGYYNTFESAKVEMDNIISSIVNNEACYYMKKEDKCE